MKKFQAAKRFLVSRDLTLKGRLKLVRNKYLVKEVVIDCLMSVIPLAWVELEKVID